MSREYHKIDTVFKRDPSTNNKHLIEGQFSRPEFEYLAGNEWTFIVARPIVELLARNGDRIITKIKHRDFTVSAAK